MDRQTTNREPRYRSPLGKAARRGFTVWRKALSPLLSSCVLLPLQAPPNIPTSFGTARTDLICSLLHCNVLWLEGQRPSQAHVLEYIVSSRWRCLGRFGPLRKRIRTVGGSSHWRHALPLWCYSLVPFAVLWVWMKCDQPASCSTIRLSSPRCTLSLGNTKLK